MRSEAKLELLFSDFQVQFAYAMLVWLFSIIKNEQSINSLNGEIL